MHNHLFEKVESRNSSFIVKGRPHHAQEVGTFIYQDIDLRYATATVNNDIFAQNFPADSGFLPHDSEFIIDDKLPLNRTFHNIRYQPDNCVDSVQIDNEEVLELRKLIASKTCREAIERVDMPQDESEYRWELEDEEKQYSELTVAVYTNGVYTVNVPIARHNRCLLLYGGSDRLDQCPIVNHASQRQLSFVFDNDKFKCSGATIQLNSAQLIIAHGGQAIVADKDFLWKIPDLETSVIQSNGYAYFGPTGAIPANRTFGFVKVPLELVTAPDGVPIDSRLEIQQAGQNTTLDIVEYFKPRSVYLCIPYFGIPFGRNTSYGRVPVLDAIVADPAANPAVLAYAGLDGTFPNMLSLNSFYGIGNTHDVEPVISTVYLRRFDGASDYQAVVIGGNAVRAHYYYIQFPFALPATFEAAANRNLEIRTQTAVANLYLRGVVLDAVIPGKPNWTIVDGAGLLAYNGFADNPHPTAGAREVIQVWVQFFESNPAADPLAIPTTDMTVVGNQQNIVATIANHPLGIQGQVISSQAAPQSPYKRSIRLSQAEPFHSMPSGLVSYPGLKMYDDIPKEFPLLVQDSKTYFDQDVSEVTRCIRPKTGEIAVSLVGTPQLGLYSRDGEMQSDKNVSTIEIALPRFEKKTIVFTTGQPVIKWSTRRGLPKYFMIRVKHAVYGNLQGKYYNAKIQSLRLEAFDQRVSFLKTIGSVELRELTRRNSHMYAEPQQNIVLVTAEQLGSFRVNPKERLDFKLTLLGYTEHAKLAGREKQFILTPIYEDALQGDRTKIELENS